MEFTVDESVITVGQSDEPSSMSSSMTFSTTSASAGGDKSSDAFKAVLLCALFVVPLVASVVPFSLRACVDRATPDRRRQRYAGLFTLLSCFGGGVFLGTCLLDLLPDALEQMYHFTANHTDSNDGSTEPQPKGYPLCQFLVAVGFFLVTFMDQMLLILRDKGIIGHGHGHSHGFASADSEPRGVDNPALSDESVASEENLSPTSGQSDRRVLFSPSTSDPADTTVVHTSPQPDESMEPPTPRLSRRQLGVTPNGQHADAESAVPTDPADVEHSGDHAQQQQPAAAVRYRSQSAVSRQSAVSNKRPHVDPASHSPVRSALLVAALSLHSIFEGLALGVDPLATDTANVFAAIMVHKTLIAFSLGVSLVQSKMRAVTIALSCAVFTLMAPLGGFAGMIIMHSVQAEAQKRVGGALTSVACGTFLYVTCMEILPHELNAPGRRVGKMLAIVAGFAVVAVMVYVEPS